MVTGLPPTVPLAAPRGFLSWADPVAARQRAAATTAKRSFIIVHSFESETARSGRPRGHISPETGTTDRPGSSTKRRTLASVLERLLEEVVDDPPVLAAPGLVHDLPHQPPEGGRPALPAP